MRHGLIDQDVQLAFAQGFRQVGLDDGQFGGFLIDQVSAARLLELADGFAPLLDHPVEHDSDPGIIEILAFIDLYLLDRREYQSYNFV